MSELGDFEIKKIIDRAREYSGKADWTFDYTKKEKMALSKFFYLHEDYIDHHVNVDDMIKQIVGEKI